MHSKFKFIIYYLLLIIAALSTQTTGTTKNYLLDIAPQFHARTLTREKISYNNLLKKGPILINFWATWCTPCIEEMKTFKQLNTLLKEKHITVLSISIDEHDKKSKINYITKKYQFPFTFIHDADKQIFRKFKAQSVPHTVIINKNNQIIYQHSGFNEASKKAFKNAIDTL